MEGVVGAAVGATGGLFSVYNHMVYSMGQEYMLFWQRNPIHIPGVVEIA